VDKFNLPRSTLFETIKRAKYVPGEKLKQLQTQEWAKVRILLKVVYRKTGAELMQRAIENGWTVRKLEEEKVRKQGRRPARGGSLQSTDLHTELARLTEKTRRWEGPAPDRSATTRTAYVCRRKKCGPTRRGWNDRRRCRSTTSPSSRRRPAGKISPPIYHTNLTVSPGLVV
jgi:hypothetical protein